MYLPGNLKFLRKRANVTQDALSADVKIGRTTIANYESGISEPNINILLTFANYFGVTLDDLLSKNLERDGIPSGSNKSDRTYSGMPHVVTVDNTGRDNIIFVPVKARAGYLSGYGDTQYISTLPAFSMPNINNGTYRMFEVDGVSMSPNIQHGDLVIGEWVESLDYIRDNQVYIIVHEGGVAVKRVMNRIKDKGKIFLKSDTVAHRAEFPILEIDPADVMEIWKAKLKISSDFTEPAEIYHRLDDLEMTMMEMKEMLKKG